MSFLRLVAVASLALLALLAGVAGMAVLHRFPSLLISSSTFPALITLSPWSARFTTRSHSQSALAWHGASLDSSYSSPKGTCGGYVHSKELAA